MKPSLAPPIACQIDREAGEAKLFLRDAKGNAVTLELRLDALAAFACNLVGAGARQYSSSRFLIDGTLTVSKGS